MSAAVEATAQGPARRYASRSIWLLIAALGVLVVVAIVAALFVARQAAATTYPANSPEGTVQRYVTFLQNGQMGKAYAMVFTSQGQSQFDEEYSNWGTQSHQVTLISSSRQGNSASVTVDVSGFDAGPLGASNSSQHVTFELVRQGRGWMITDPPYLP